MMNFIKRRELSLPTAQQTHWSFEIFCDRERQLGLHLCFGINFMKHFCFSGRENWLEKHTAKKMGMTSLTVLYCGKRARIHTEVWQPASEGECASQTIQLIKCSKTVTPRPHRVCSSAAQHKRWRILHYLHSATQCCEHPPWQQLFPFVALYHADVT